MRKFATKIALYDKTAKINFEEYLLFVMVYLIKIWCTWCLGWHFFVWIGYFVFLVGILGVSIGVFLYWDGVLGV